MDCIGGGEKSAMRRRQCWPCYHAMRSVQITKKLLPLSRAGAWQMEATLYLSAEPGARSVAWRIRDERNFMIEFHYRHDMIGHA